MPSLARLHQIIHVSVLTLPNLSRWRNITIKNGDVLGDGWRDYYPLRSLRRRPAKMFALILLDSRASFWAATSARFPGAHAVFRLAAVNRTKASGARLHFAAVTVVFILVEVTLAARARRF